MRHAPCAMRHAPCAMRRATTAQNARKGESKMAHEDLIVDMSCILECELDGWVSDSCIFKHDDETNIVWQLISTYLFEYAYPRADWGGARNRLLVAESKSDMISMAKNFWVHLLLDSGRGEWKDPALVRARAEEFWARRYVEKGDLSYEARWRAEIIDEAGSLLERIAEAVAAGEINFNEMGESVWEGLSADWAEGKIASAEIAGD
jgi:hypothetical protein